MPFLKKMLPSQTAVGPANEMLKSNLISQKSIEITICILLKVSDRILMVEVEFKMISMKGQCIPLEVWGDKITNYKINFKGVLTIRYRIKCKEDPIIIY